ncbi:MAG: PhoH family protein, partial [Rhodanobacteraceae bacterium]
MAQQVKDKRTFALDTNVLLHDPTALFRFEEHDVFIPMTVLEELDEKKQGVSEVARNARQASRFLNELIERNNSHGIADGVPLAQPDGIRLRSGGANGRLYFQTRSGSGQGKADNRILAAILDFHEHRPEAAVALVSKDINLRIKATIFGVPAEDYENDRALDDFSLLYTGSVELPADFWDRHPELRSWSERGHTFYELKPREDEAWQPNECLYLPGENSVELRVLESSGEKTKLALLGDYTGSAHGVWGITARNREQNFALNMLMDPDIDFVTLLGTAGTGKTLLALAAGLAQVMDQQRYREIIMTRATVSVGEDIGFLPGTEEEKMTPWMGALTDNLEVLANPE